MKYNNFIKNSCHYGDILAIPFFGLLVIYLYQIPHKTVIEGTLLFFAVCGFIFDMFYTYLFLSGVTS
jgi:hypothetical protein